MRRLLVGLVTLLLLGIAVPAAAISKTVKFPCGWSHGPLNADPIVSPGVVSAHAHEFFGNETTNKDSTFDSMVGQPTTCNFTGDTAGYWTPELLAPDGSRIAPLRAVIYYDRMTSQSVVPYPNGLGVIVGYGHTPFSSKQRSYYGWVCDNRDPLQPNLSNVDCRPYTQANQFISARFFFPFCLSNGSLSYPVNYPSNDLCPSGTQAVPRLREVFKWNVSYCPSCTLSSGGSETIHADFWNTWVPSGLQNLVNQLNG
jgi:hypothetical protein